MKHNLKLAGIVAGMTSALVAGASSSDPLAYDGMAPATGMMQGVNDPASYGWRSPWDIQNQNPAYQFVSGSLSYGPLLTSGNKARVGGGWVQGGRSLDGAGMGIFDTAGFCSDAWTAGLIDQKSVWISFLAQYEGSNTDLRLSLGNSNISWYSDVAAVQIGTFGGANDTWAARVNRGATIGAQDYVAPVSLATILAEPTTKLFVVNIDNDNARVRVWINPAFSSLGNTEPAPAASFENVAYTGRAFKNFSTYPSSGNNMLLDEIRVGDSWASVTPASAAGPAIMGMLNLEDYPLDRVAGLVASFEVTKSDGTVLDPVNVTLGAGGSYSMSIPAAGTYQVRVKVSHWLSGLATDVVVASSETTLDLALLNGDVDQDNAVTVFDYDRLSQAFDSTPIDSAWDADADLDGDDTVSVFDYDILSRNFDRTGQ